MTGQSILSKSAVSEVTERLWAEYQAFRQQVWDGVEIVYLFADGLYEPQSHPSLSLAGRCFH